MTLIMMLIHLTISIKNYLKDFNASESGPGFQLLVICGYNHLGLEINSWPHHGRPLICHPLGNATSHPKYTDISFQPSWREESKSQKLEESRDNRRTKNEV